MGWDGNGGIAPAIYATYSDYKYASKDKSEYFSIIVLAIPSSEGNFHLMPFLS